ncbi:hypothetical protein VCRA2123O444_320040 [Vibrio crassostreae]|uniref:nitroreductase family protein n=1 Tax=Vibrio crassostreae TaxID=246167 RepID=UPI001B304D96|nr:nitroreductase family protein [Vibrio crassostreae]CAK1934879.1 hypothetical protein VCRA2118O429_250010 [Vibrio crassostreae]CAK1940174.1 hypothetical protein VCRA2113O412_260010 [Vibrio crassostreae]CAK1940896.1 hypothetical protein VCRA2113O413_260010 [Vibrio crassostreae]CAK1945183.1 hypothetical protein VCRA2119O432_260063 [Vibrio crassostreae]CAK1946253.1 hypothetical protein VCRA2114O423_260062 [Vibrio crassostreae]
MEVSTAIYSRFSERFFLENKIPFQDVEELISSALAAPTSCNMQVYNFILVEDKDILDEFAKEVTGKVNWTRQLLVMTIDPRITFERHANYISAGMAVQNLLLMATSMDIKTCPIAGFKGTRYIKKTLSIPDEYDVPLLVFIGKSNNKKEQLHGTYRKPIKDTLGINKFPTENPFPTNSNLSLWSQSDVLRYRSRILSVYYPRLRHGLWKIGLDKLYQSYNTRNEGKDLLIFPSERYEFKIIEDNDGYYTADIVESYVDFLKSKSVDSFLVGRDLEYDIKFDNIYIFNKLMFQKDIDMIFEFLSNVSNKSTKITLSEFNPMGCYGLSYRILRLFGKQKDVYHNSSFYKYGPYRFITKKTLMEYCEKHQFKLIEEKFCYTSVMQNKVPKYLRWLLKIYSYIIPETYILEVKKK